MAQLARTYYEGTLEFGNTFVHVKRDGTIAMSGDLTADELSLVALLSDCIRQLRQGKSLSHGFDPTYLYNGDEDVHCRWTDRNYLVISEERPPRRFKHATTQIAALTRHGAFTTSRSIAFMLPRLRTAEMLRAVEISSLSSLSDKAGRQ